MCFNFLAKSGWKHLARNRKSPHEYRKSIKLHLNRISWSFSCDFKCGIKIKAKWTSKDVHILHLSPQKSYFIRNTGQLWVLWIVLLHDLWPLFKPFRAVRTFRLPWKSGEQLVLCVWPSLMGSPDQLLASSFQLSGLQSPNIQFGPLFMSHKTAKNKRKAPRLFVGWTLCKYFRSTLLTHQLKAPPFCRPSIHLCKKKKHKQKEINIEPGLILFLSTFLLPNDSKKVFAFVLPLFIVRQVHETWKVYRKHWEKCAGANYRCWNKKT